MSGVLQDHNLWPPQGQTGVSDVWGVSEWELSCKVFLDSSRCPASPTCVLALGDHRRLGQAVVSVVLVWRPLTGRRHYGWNQGCRQDLKTQLGSRYWSQESRGTGWGLGLILTRLQFTTAVEPPATLERGCFVWLPHTVQKDFLV